MYTVDTRDIPVHKRLGDMFRSTVELPDGRSVDVACPWGGVVAVYADGTWEVLLSQQLDAPPEWGCDCAD